MLISVVFATLTGLSFSLNALDLFYAIEKVGFPVTQMNMDGALALGLIFLGLFVESQVHPSKDASPFTVGDLLQANGAHLLTLIAVICFSFALQYGNAGIL